MKGEEMKKILVFFVTLVALVMAAMALAMPPPSTQPQTAGHMAIMEEHPTATPATTAMVVDLNVFTAPGPPRYGEAEAQPAAPPTTRRPPQPEPVRKWLITAHTGAIRPVLIKAYSNEGTAFRAWHEDGDLASQGVTSHHGQRAEKSITRETFGSPVSIFLQ